MTTKVDTRRIFSLNGRQELAGPILYWMSRDQRTHDNWALLYAQELAEKNHQPLIVVFCLVPHFLDATIRQFGFMLRGLEEVEKELQAFNIPFHLLLGEPPHEIVSFAKRSKAGAVVMDFDPLKIKKRWQREAAEHLECAAYEVDAHNIVPCRIASTKLEFGAYTLRPKLHKVLNEYLTDFPRLKKQEFVSEHAGVNWKQAHETLRVNREIPEVSWCIPGERAAHETLKKFIDHGLARYAQYRNDPTETAQSNLSPYLHFGQISAQRIAHTLQKNEASTENTDDFLEELIVRRELADNFCFYNPQYDTVEGFPAWATKTLAEHAHDAREYVYSKKDFEHAQTHDPLWNAAQLQMVRTGKMHGYLRMYWAKKILEWTENPADALRIAIYLNDTYELDGRDPNGYAGIAWSIGGVHDRAWFDRPIFGKIRYMNYNGCASKFDVKKFISLYATPAEPA